ncbi:hypothetical protein [Reyranella sp.]|uniref:hypothetical protein n=1 Tax=Reyranella sp. TaxID=1929291 RepID=UPI0037845ACB
MSKHHAQKRAAKAARRKKLAAERRKVALAESQMSLATRVRRMAVAPMHSCLMSETLWESGSGYLVVARKASDGQVAMATFLLDTYCIGVKDVILRVDGASTIDRFMEALGDVQPMIAIEPTRARKLLRDLVAWARSLGLAPHPDYAVAEPLFGDVSADACDESFSFGKDGKPFLIPGPGDTPARIRKRVEALRRTVGDDGFDYVLEVGMEDDDVLDDEEADIDDMAEIDDAVESVTGMRYDPHAAPDPSRWLDIGEDERILLAEAYHRRAADEVPNAKLHALMHVFVENQVAIGDELPVRRAIERLIGEGLDRHDAVHAVGSVLAAHLTDTLKAEAQNNEAYYAAVERLTADSWRAEFGSIADDERP